MVSKLRLVAMGAVLSLLAGPGCASRWHGGQPDGGYTSPHYYPANGDLLQGPVQGLSDASFNDWNSRRLGW